MAGGLPFDRLGDAMATITSWRVDPETPVACPVCGASGLEIVDRSARPYAEWYLLRCKACGLDETLNIPMRGPASLE